MPQTPTAFDPLKAFQFVTPPPAPVAPTPAPTPAHANPLAGLEPTDEGEGGDWLSSIKKYFKGVANTTIVPIAEMIVKQNDPQFLAETGKGIINSTVDQLKKSKAAWDKGDKVEALGHLGGAVPFIGTGAAAAGEKIASGDTAEGLGEATGILLPFGVHPAFKFATESRMAGAAGELADRLATRKMAKTITPTSGEQKTRFAAMADKAAPDLLRDQATLRGGGATVSTAAMDAWSKADLRDKVGTARTGAIKELDDAYGAIPEKERMSLGPLAKSIQAEIDKLTVRGTKTGPGVFQDEPLTTEVKMPDGTTRVKRTSELGDQRIKTPTGTEPVGSADRLAALRTALSEVKAVGQSASASELRKLFSSWGSLAEREFTPATAPDFMKARGEGAGFASAESMGREFVNAQYPELKGPNAKYSLFNSVDRIMRAAHEADTASSGALRRGIKGAVVGEVVGSAMGYPGVGSAAVGAAMAPILDAASASGVTSQIATARGLAKFADYMKAKQFAKAEAALVSTANKSGSVLTKPALQGLRSWFDQLRSSDDSGR